jgi:hypothetical protein
MRRRDARLGRVQETRGCVEIRQALAEIAHDQGIGGLTPRAGLLSLRACSLEEFPSVFVS